MVRVRAQRKSLTGTRKVAKQCSDPNFKSPKRKTAAKMNGFQGKLNHASPPKIPPRSMNTRYFSKCQQVSYFLDDQALLVSESNACQEIATSLFEPINIQIPTSQDLHIPTSPRTSSRLHKTTTELNVVTLKTEPANLGVKTEPRQISDAELTSKELKTEEHLFEDKREVEDECVPTFESESIPLYETEVTIEESEVTYTPRKALEVKEEANYLSANAMSEPESVISPPSHKIQLCNDVVTDTQSPSSALSFMHISATPSKAVKSKRRLNPSQKSNQQMISSPTSTTPSRGMTKKSIGVSISHKLTEYYPIVRRSVRKTKRTVLEEKQMLLEEAVKTESEEGLEIRNFEGKGRGIVATRRFFKGDFVVEYSGELIDMCEAKEREQLYTQDQNTGCYMYYFKYKNNQYCIDATKESGRLGRLVNHSRNGNLITKTVPIGTKPHLVLIAKECIEEGDEVLYDYGDRSKESLTNHPWLNL